MQYNILDILKTDKPSDIFRELDKSSILLEVLPELCALKSTDAGHKDNFEHTLKVLDNTCEVTKDVYLRLTAILHDIGKAITKEFKNGTWTFQHHEEVGSKMILPIFQRLKLDMSELDRVEKITKYHGRVKELSKEVTDSAVRRFYKEFGSDYFDDLILFCQQDCTTKYTDKKLRLHNELEKVKIRTYEIKQQDLEKTYRIPIDGIWLMQITGLKGGIWIKEIKDLIEKAIKEGVIEDTKEAAEKMAIQILIDKKLYV